jgi:hypothetical protein
MKPTVRYQSQLLPRRSYKPARIYRVRPVDKVILTFRPLRGVSTQK